MPLSARQDLSESTERMVSETVLDSGDNSVSRILRVQRLVVMHHTFVGSNRTPRYGATMQCWRCALTMTFFNPNYFLHAANVLLLVAYSVRDILWLRLFAVLAAVISIPYFVLQPQPLWVPIGWSVVFATINLIQSWFLFVERRPVQLTAEEAEIRRLAFQELPPRKVLQVLSIGGWITLSSGELVLKRGRCPDAILMIVRGTVRVTNDEGVFGDLVPGNFVGSALVLSGAPSEVDAITTEPLRALRWDIEILEKYLSAHPEVRIVMQRHLSRDLAGKFVSYAHRRRGA